MINFIITNFYAKKLDGLIFANPGSISVPRNNSEHSYMIIDDKNIILKDVNGNILKEKNYLKLKNTNNC